MTQVKMSNDNISHRLEEATAAAALGSTVTSLTDTPVVPEQPTEETVKECHDRLTQEREILLKRIEVQSLEREVRILQKRLDRGSEDDEQCGRPEAKTIGTLSQSRDSTSSASKWHRTLGDDDLLPLKRVPPTSGIKLVAPEKYNG